MLFEITHNDVGIVKNLKVMHSLISRDDSRNSGFADVNEVNKSSLSTSLTLTKRNRATIKNFFVVQMQDDGFLVL